MNSACAPSLPTATLVYRIYWRTGAQAQAQAHLTTATSMYRDMDMQVWLEKAEVEIKDLG
jgi:hypothetical protein